MIESKQVEISDRTYYITPFSGTKGLAYLNKLKSIVGPSLASLFASSDGDADGDLAVQSNTLEDAVKALIENMDKGEAETLILEWVKNYVHNAKKQPVNFDSEFSAGFHYLALIIKEIITINYGSLFFLKDGLGAPSVKSL